MHTGIEGFGQPPSLKSPKATTHPDSPGDEASYRARTVARFSAGNERAEPCNSGYVEKRASNDGVDATVNRDLVVVNTPRVELSNTLANADEALLVALKQRFAVSGTEGISTQKDNPLHYAATHGLIQSVQFLLSIGDKQQWFTLRDREQNNLVHLAAKGGHTRLLHWLIDQYGSRALMVKGNHGFLAIHHAAREGHLKCVQLLLTFGHSGLFDTDEQGNNPVHWAARSGNLKVLQCMVDQYQPHILTLSGDKGLRPLHIAAHSGHMDCVSYILETCPDILILRDNIGRNAIHQAAGMGNTEIVKYLIPWADPEDLLAQDENGNTALHLAASGGHEKVVEILLNASDEILGINNYDPYNAAHLAAAYGHLPVLKQIARRNMDTILEPGCRCKTPLHTALQFGRIECVKWLLSNATIRKNLTRINLFSTLISNDAQCQSLLARARKELAEPRRSQAPRHLAKINPVGVASEWPPTRPKKKTMGHAGEWPEFSVQPKQWSSPFVDQAKAVLTGFGAAGIYLANKVYSDHGETKDKFWSAGDLNAGVQMANILQDMGLESLEVVLSPPDNSSCQQRMEHTHDQRHDYARLQEIARYKLARLWPEIDPEKPLPQVLKLGNCQVTFRECDDPAPLPQVMLSFCDVKEQLRDTGKLPENGIILKPYRYFSSYQQIVADIHDGRGNMLPLNLPPNSVIPEAQRSRPNGRLLSDTSLLVELVNHLGRRSLAAKIDLSVVYGLHHQAIANPERVLEKWVESIRELGSTALVKKPAIIAVASNVCLEDALPDFARKMALPLVDLGAIALASNADREGVARTVQEQIDNLPPGDPAICILPSLPKHQFDDLVLSSRLPVLAEGANLTSFLLEHGRPHLSLLPSGNTPVTQDMGDPFEAIKAEAFSSKLSMDEQSLKFLTSLKSLLDGDERAEAYQEALRRIDAMDKKEALAFLWRDQRKDTFLGLEQLSIRTLLEQGSSNATLGEAGRKALMSALDPTSQGLMQYIREAMSEDSPTAMHFKLQQMHLEGPAVNAINSTLVKLGRYKGWIK